MNAPSGLERLDGLEQPNGLEWLDGLDGMHRTYGMTETEHEPVDTCVAVSVHAPDPATRKSVLDQLRGNPDLTLADPFGAEPGTVAVVVVGTLDKAALTRIGEIVRGRDTRAVLVADTVLDAQLLDLVGRYGVGTVVWRREATGSRLADAVLTAARGEVSLPGDLLRRVIDRTAALLNSSAGRVASLAIGLTPREREVLELVAEGWSTGEIAVELVCSERTVRSVMQQLRTRLDLRNNEHAVAYALRESFLR